MKALIGRKIGMTRIFDEQGNTVPVTLVEAGPCVVTQVKDRERDGYNAVQIGFGAARRQKRPLMGHLKMSASNPEILREIRLPEAHTPTEADAKQQDLQLKVGSKLDVSTFEVGEDVQVSGISKGKGFAGTIKRHNFSRGPKTHGSRNYRKPGSIGAGFPEHVFKGIKMAGRMGGEQVTVKGLKVAAVDAEKNILAIRGAVPGANKGFVIIRGSNG